MGHNMIYLAASSKQNGRNYQRELSTNLSVNSGKSNAHLDPLNIARDRFKRVGTRTSKQGFKLVSREPCTVYAFLVGTCTLCCLSLHIICYIARDFSHDIKSFNILSSYGDYCSDCSFLLSPGRGETGRKGQHSLASAAIFGFYL